MTRGTWRGTLTVLAAIGTTLALVVPAPAAYADPVNLDCLSTTLELERSACSLLGGAKQYPCSYGGVDIAIGAMSAEVVRDPLSGDISYRWSAPSQVRVNGDCDQETVSLVTYTDTPDRIAGAMGVEQSSQTYRKQVRGQVTVGHAPKWELNYYRLGGLYVRAVSGKVSMLVEGRFMNNGFEYWTGECKQKTWYYQATPTGPQFQQTVEQYVSCPGW